MAFSGSGSERVLIRARAARTFRSDAGAPWYGACGPPRLPKDTDFACVVESNVPVVVQHTRLDSRQPENALLSTMAFPADG
jgi:hypothetical protein